MNVKDMTLSQATAFISAVGTTNTVLLRGQPGIGKSSILRTLAASHPDYRVAYFDCANMDLGDVTMPVVNRESMTTEYAPNALFGVGKGQDTPVIIMLDELGKCAKPVMNMLLPVMLERRVGSHSLPVGSIVFATTNMDTDGVGDNVPAHAMNRRTEIICTNPTTDEWLAWAAGNDVAPEIMMFAKDTPQAFDMYRDADGDANPYIFNPKIGQTRQFCSPRSLEKASHIIKARMGFDAEALLSALAGTVGEAAARDIEANISMLDALPRFTEIIADPKGTRVPTPEQPSASFLLSFMLSGRMKPENVGAVVTYVERWTNSEAISLFLAMTCKSSAKVGFAMKHMPFTTLVSKHAKYFS